MPEHRLVVEVVGGVPVVAVPEEIDMTNADGLRAALLEAAARGRGTFVADMSRTRFCDSAGIQALVRAHNRSQAEGGEMLLAVSAAAVLRVFALMGVDRLIPSFPTLHEALAQATAAWPGRHSPALMETSSAAPSSRLVPGTTTAAALPICDTA